MVASWTDLYTIMEKPYPPRSVPDERVHAKVRILAHSVEEAVWPPRVGEEDDRDGLAEVVQLQPARADRVHGGRVIVRSGVQLTVARN